MLQFLDLLILNNNNNNKKTFALVCREQHI